MRYDVDEEDEQTIARYLEGLRTEIVDVIHLQQYWSFNDVCRLALEVEKQNKQKSSSWRGSSLNIRAVQLEGLLVEKPRHQQQACHSLFQLRMTKEKQ